VSLDSLPKAIDDVLSAYSGVLQHPVAHEMSANRVWRIADQHEERFVLKRFAESSTADSVRRFVDEARVVSYLAQQGFPVAVPILSDHGVAFVHGRDGGMYALSPLLARSDAAFDAGTRNRNLGAMLARLHVALDRCPFHLDSSLIGRGTIDSGRLSSCRDRLESDLPPNTWHALASLIDPWMDSMRESFEVTAPQRIHGDAHGGNLLFDGNSVSGIIDVDHLPLAARIYDLAYYLAFGVHWRVEHPSMANDMSFEARTVLGGYHAESVLSKPEREALPAMSLAVALFLLEFFLWKEGIVEDSWIRTAEWITDHPCQLTIA
jgi:Ser/Thr protein kinase RdoA (MazF antagonist)